MKIRNIALLTAGLLAQNPKALYQENDKETQFVKEIEQYAQEHEVPITTGKTEDYDVFMKTYSSPTDTIRVRIQDNDGDGTLSKEDIIQIGQKREGIYSLEEDLEYGLRHNQSSLFEILNEGIELWPNSNELFLRDLGFNTNKIDYVRDANHDTKVRSNSNLQRLKNIINYKK